MLARREVSEAVAEQGYAVVREHRPEADSLEAFLDFGEIETVEGLNTVQQLVPRDRIESLPNTYSGNFGVEEFPLHTDLAHWATPPLFLALRCVTGTSLVPTRILDGQLLVQHFGLKFLRSLLVQPRRPMRNGKQLLQLLERVGPADRFRIRWDSIYLKAATVRSASGFEKIKDFLASSIASEVLLLKRGDTLIIDNWRCLHGRASVGTTARRRHIDRAYLRTLS
jgi:L-asparagine oxygenase